MTKSRFDRWSTSGILAQGSPEWWAKQFEIARTMAPIVRNPRIPDSASMVPPAKDETPRAPGNGWVEAAPLKGVDVRWCDRQVDAQEEKERKARQREAIQNELINREIEQRLAKDTDKVKSEYEPFSRTWMQKGFDDSDDDR